MSVKARPCPATDRLPRHLMLLAALACAMPAVAGDTSQTPSQSPLVNQPDTEPSANVMFTLDDSGSMTYQYLPERSFTLNSQTVDFPNDAKVFMHPLELARNMFTFSGGRDTHIVTATLDDTQFDTNTTKLYQYQMRSPQVNTIYYNPQLLYTPWQTVEGIPFANASPTQAHLDPLALHPDATISAKANSTHVDLTAEAPRKARWYCGVGSGAPSYTPCAESEKKYNPALVYLLKKRGNPNDTASYSAYNLNDGQDTVVYTFPPEDADNESVNFTNRLKQGGGCTSSGNVVTCSKSAELTNFANWFVYYRSRLLIAQGTVPEALRSLSDNVRLGWGTIHQGITYDKDGVPSDTLGTGLYTVDGEGSTTVQQGVRNLDFDHKKRFTNWIRSIKTYAGTPTKGALLGVGAYFKRRDNLKAWSSPWSSNPGRPDLPDDISKHLGCRRASNILLTDGYYSDTVQAVGNVDNNAEPADTGARYTPAYPFKDEASNTLADIAMQFWSQDLQPDIANEVRPLAAEVPSADLDIPLLTEIKSDPATWQHLRQVMVGFGLSGKLVSKSSVLKELNLLRLANCGEASGLCWENPPDKIDDLWHAAINSRGLYFSADNPTELAEAIKSALGSGLPSPYVEGGLATVSAELIDGNVKYVPEYTTRQWTGDLRAYGLDAQGNASAAPIWSASEKVPAPETRNIVVWNKASGSTGGQAVEFRTSTSTATTTAFVDRLGLPATEDAAKLVRYIRGEDVDATFRKREGRLPDFVNSTPLFVRGGQDMGYASLTSSTSTTATADATSEAVSIGDAYAQYRNNRLAATKGVILQGGNGGMLHAFDAKDGTETFAFIPDTALPNLRKLGALDYGSSSNFHQYFVDGPLVQSDAYGIFSSEDNAPRWHNIVVGTMGAGGQSIFALTMPIDDPTALGANHVLWELSSQDSPYIGYITSEPQVGVLPDNTWKVFVGNGVASPQGKAALLMIDLTTRAITAIEAEETTTGTTTDTTTPNGLGGVRLVKDVNNKVVGAYAGDQQGRLWRFNVDTSGSTMSLGNGGRPLFEARSALNTVQPILTAPAVFPMAKTSSAKGQMVVVSTGQLLTQSDKESTDVQSAYGIWDSALFDGTATDAITPFTYSRSNLVQQAIALPSGDSGNQAARQFYEVSKNDVALGDSVKGWALDLAFPTRGSGEHHPKAIYDPIKFGPLVLISAIKPAGYQESCVNTGGQGFNLLISANTGGRLNVSVIDVNGDGTVDDTDPNLSGFSYVGGKQVILTKNGNEGNLQDSRGGTAIKYPALGRKILDRVWRQLLNPPSPDADTTTTPTNTNTTDNKE